MANPGDFKLISRNRAFDAYAGLSVRRERRIDRLLDSLQREISEESSQVRIRRVFERPREVFRIEIETPSLGYQRTTLLDRAALETLLEAEGVRERVQLRR
jgi:hypothetical protein